MFLEQVGFIPFVEDHVVTRWLADYVCRELHVIMGLTSLEGDIHSLVGVQAADKRTAVVLVNAYGLDDHCARYIFLPFKAGGIELLAEHFQYILALLGRQDGENLVLLCMAHGEGRKQHQNGE